jgi:hypothetical protein
MTVLANNVEANAAAVPPPVGLPTLDAFRFRAFRITKTNKYSKWAQDKAHVGPRGIVCVPYMEGDGHHDLANTLWCTYSVDGGATFGPRECIYRPETTNIPVLPGSADDTFSCMSAGASIDGRQFFFLTTKEMAPKHYMLHRKFPDYRKWDTGTTISITSGSTSFTVAKFNHGYVAGDKITLEQLLIGGVNMLPTFHNLTLSGELTVTSASNAQFTVQTTGAAANATLTAQTASVWLRNGWGDINKLDVTSVLNTLYTNLHGAANLPDDGLPYHHSFCIDENGSIYSTISIAPKTPANAPAIVHVVRYDSYRSVTTSNTFLFSLGFQGGEGTIKNVGSGVFIGFSRGDDFGSGNRANFWKTTDNFASTGTTPVPTEILRPNDTLAGRTWDEPTPLIIANGMVYAARCQRTDDPTRTTETDRASAKIYLLVANLSDLLSSGISAFTWTEVGRAYWSGAKTSQGGPGVGVGSLIAVMQPPDVKNTADTNDVTAYARIMYFFGSEQESPTGFSQNWNQGQVYCIEITDLRAPYYAMNNGDTVESGQSDNTQTLWIKDGFTTGWTPSVGPYQGTAPSTPVDLRSSQDYKGGGLRLEREYNGMVTMFGRMDYGTTANSAIVYTLPHRWRPAHDKQFVIQGAQDQTRASGALYVLTIFGSNNVASLAGQMRVDRVDTAKPIGSGSVVNISFDGVRFPADGDARTS